MGLDVFYVWPMLLVIVTPTAVLFWLGRRDHPPGHCQRCGYDLTGNITGRCPACGTEIG
jgi:hypothetical protein